MLEVKSHDLQLHRRRAGTTFGRMREIGNGLFGNTAFDKLTSS
jgi:hypothetical protein